MKSALIVCLLLTAHTYGNEKPRGEFKDVALRIASSTVKVSGFSFDSTGGSVESIGTGFIIDSLRTVVSCAHIFFARDSVGRFIKESSGNHSTCVDTSKMISRVLSDGRMSNIHIKGIFFEDDLVFLSLDEGQPDPVSIYPIDTLEITSPIGCIGSTNGIGITIHNQPLEGTVVLKGMISVLGMNLIQETSSYYNKFLVQMGTIPGLSGSPVFSVQSGKVIGMAQSVPVIIQSGVRIVPDITVCLSIQRIMALYKALE